MNHLPDCYPLNHLPAQVAQLGVLVSGNGGQWVPYVVEIESGRFVAALCPITPDFQPVGFVPIWATAAAAMYQAYQLATIAAA